MTCLIWFKDFPLFTGAQIFESVGNGIIFCTERPGLPEVQNDVLVYQHDVLRSDTSSHVSNIC